MHVFEYKKNNLSISYKNDFVYDDKYKIKIQAGIIRINSLAESIWVLIHPDDYKDWENNIIDIEYNRVAFLLNRSIYGPEWGSPIPYKLRGSERPISIYDDYSDDPDDLHNELSEYLELIRK